MQLPESMRGLVREHVRSTPGLLDHIEDELPGREQPGEYLMKVAIDEALFSRAGVLALIGHLEVEADPAIRIKIAERLALFAILFGKTDPFAFSGKPPVMDDASSLAEPISIALENAVARITDASEQAQLVDHFVLFQKRRIWASLLPGIEASEEAGDKQGADLLRLKNRSLFSPGTLPAFFYEEFPAVEADVPVGDPIRVLVFGDFGTGRHTQYEAAAAMQKEHAERPFNLGITVGDNFMPNGLDHPLHPRWRTEWEEPYGKMGIVIYPSLGNHDYEGTGSVLAKLEYSQRSETWELPAPNYSVRAGPVEFFAIDTNLIMENQLEWLRKRLAESDAKWKIVYGHHPVYSSGYVSDRRKEPGNLVDRLLPLLKDAGAHVYLNGHNHIMEEWSPLEGVHLFTIGAGGSSLYDRKRDDRSVFMTGQHGFGVLQISDGELSVQFINVEGEVIHERVINKD